MSFFQLQRICLSLAVCSQLVHTNDSLQSEEILPDNPVEESADMPLHEISTEALETEDASLEDESDNQDVHASNVYKAKAELAWGNSDHIEVYYCEFLLAQWVLDRSPWNAYHSGLCFVNNRTGQRALYEYTPVDTSSVMNMLVPQLSTDDLLSILAGNVKLEWKDGARSLMQFDWSDKYENFVKLAVLNGSVFEDYADWVANEYAPTHKSFQPVEVAVVPTAESAERSAKALTKVKSTMCHDFVTESLWFFYDRGVELKADSRIFRDHIIMYASDIRELTGEEETFYGMRSWLRYLRQLSLWMHLVRKQFTHAREVLIMNWRLGLQAYHHTETANYRVTLEPPFLNYCYLPLALPPEVHDPFGSTKLCALGLVANVTNVTAPWPWAVLLSAEERLDRFEVFIAVPLVAAIAVIAATA